jgi:hypothetical protein
MLYADDLTLTANDPVQLRKMLKHLQAHAARKCADIQRISF